LPIREKVSFVGLCVDNVVAVIDRGVVVVVRHISCVKDRGVVVVIRDVNLVNVCGRRVVCG
jgi:hypothetical protein